MNRQRRRVVAGLATAVAGSLIPGISVKGAPTMTDPALIKKLDTVFNAHMEAELAGDLDKTWRKLEPEGA